MKITPLGLLVGLFNASACQRRFSLIGLSLLIAANGWSAPQRVKTTVGLGADTYVRGGAYASTNYNDDVNQQIYIERTSNLDGSRKGYVRFDLSSTFGPAQQVTLRFHVRIDTPTRIYVYGLNDGTTGDGSSGWTETGVTWNNAPANNTTSNNGVTSAATLLGSFDVTDTADNSSGPYDFSNAALKDFINADTNGLATVILTSEELSSGGNNSIGFYQKEFVPSGGGVGDRAPELLIEPSPTSIKTNVGAGADTYVRSGTYADTNYNNDVNQQIWIEYSTGSNAARKGYLRFDRTGVSGPFDAAHVVFNVRIDTATQINVYGLNNGATGDASGGWGETTITWNNAPGNATSSANGVTSSATLLGSFTLTDTVDNTSGPYVFSSEDHAALKTFVNNDTNNLLTFILTGGTLSSGGDHSVGFYQKEYTPSGGSAGDEASTLILMPQLSTQTDYTITATAGTNGSITPSGAVTVLSGADQTFTITPNSGYHVSSLLVDGTSVGAVTTYTFDNVQSDHTIDAAFAINTYTITATATSGGSISPSGSVSVNHGSNKSFTISPNSGYQVQDVTVNGDSVGAVTSYTFNNVTEDHEIAAAFELIPSPGPAVILKTSNNGADTYVRGGTYADTNYNSDADKQIYLDYAGTLNGSRKGYLRFDISTASPTFERAELVLFVRVDTATRVNVYGLNNGVTGDGSSGWGETTITWNNAPANNTSSGNGVTSAASLLGTFDVTDTTDNSSGPYVFSSDSNAALLDFIKNDTNDRVTFILTTVEQSSTAGEHSLGFYQKEYVPSGGSAGDEAPQLRINADPFTGGGSGGGSGDTTGIGPNPYGGTDYFVTPSTIGSKIGLLTPGDRLVLKDGQYSPLNISNMHGTSSKPITFISENDRKGFVKSNGTTYGVYVIGSSNLVFERLRIENSDNSNNTKSNGRILQVHSSTRITVRRCLLAKPNRWGNNSAMTFGDGSTYCLAEDNELYNFHRNGLTIHGYDSQYNVLRRNYMNSRGVSWLGQKYGPNDAVSLYQGADSIIENCLVEYPGRQGHGVGTWGLRNKFYGNIAYNAQSCGYAITANTSGLGDDAVFKNNVAINCSRGFFINTVKNALFENSTSYNAAAEGYVALNKRLSSRPAGWKASFTVRNMLTVDSGSYGYEVEDDLSTYSSRVIDYSSGWNNAAGTWGPGTGTRTNTVAGQNPGFTATQIYIPVGSPYKGAGLNGADVGANVLYRYQDGVLTSTRLWDPTTGKFRGQGAQIAGVNDIAGSSLFDFHSRIGVSGSSLPSGY